MIDAAPQPKQNMGQPVPRIDGRLKVTGAAQYPADIPLSNMAHGVLATSTIARGEVRMLHLDEAWAVPGVIDIVTYGDVEGQLEPPDLSSSNSTSIGPLHSRTIFHDGQIMALVVAETLEAAREAAMLIRADYAEQPPSATIESSGAVIQAATDIAIQPSEEPHEDPSVGNFDLAFAAAAVKLEERYSTPAQHHNPIELFSTTAYWINGELVINEPSQNVTGWKAELARQMKLQPEQVRIHSPYIGGAFGSKGPMSPRTAIIALAARRVGRPVRCEVTRMQGFTTQTYRAETRHDISMGTDPAGKITAFRHEGLELTSRPDPYYVAGTETTSRMYGYGSVLTKVSIVKADRNTPGYMRSPPETPYVYALENAMDEMAVKLGMDPVEFRRLNDTMNEPIEGKPFSTRSLMQCYDEAAQAFGWSSRDATVGSMRDGDWLVGLGCATAIYPTNVAPCAARVRMTADGRVRVQTASHEIGTGVRTVAAQMAAERLGSEVGAVEVQMGDSSLPPAPVAGGSNSTASVCSAIIKACSAVRSRLFAALTGAGEGPFAGTDPGGLDLVEGMVVGPNFSEPLAAAMSRVGLGAIEEYAEFSPQGAPPNAVPSLYQGKMVMQSGDSGEKMKYAFGAEFVEVRINARTREIRVPRIVGAFAAGRIMNTRTARSQLMGGMIWGISCALHEVTEVDLRAARYVNRELQDYLVPVNADIQNVEVILVPEVDPEVNPAGVKGLGELGNVGTPAAIASAIYHATGKRLRDLPFRIDDLIGS